MFYDSMLAKLIVVAETRNNAIQKMELALDSFPILGITTNMGFLKELIQHPNFVDGTFDTKLIERDFSSYKKLVSESSLHETAIAALLYEWAIRKDKETFSHSLNGWRNIHYQPQSFEVEFGTGKVKLEYRYKQDGKFDVKSGEENYAVKLCSAEDNFFVIEIDNHRNKYVIAKNETEYFIQHPSGGAFRLKEVPRFEEPGNAAAKGGYIAPMPGEIVKVLVKAGDKVQSGKGLLVMSSMKMETTIEAHSDGEVEEVFVAERAFVEANTLLLKMK
jgi:acetyl/propionyl-CoA carboxylase alpha subunit